MSGRNRRRKDVPFNPFAPNAVAERNRRQAERVKEKRRQDAQNTTPGASSVADKEGSSKTLDELRLQAQKKLSKDGDSKVEDIPNEPVVMEEVESKPIIIQTVESASATKKPSREERLAELKRKSKESKDNAKLRKSAKPAEIKEEQIEAELTAEISVPKSDIESQEKTTTIDSDEKNLNIFKTIKSADPKSAGISKKKRKIRRIDKKGGGRQKFEKKLKRQKILEFKYVAREILENPDVPEEHRSNILGQIIAKGERISIDSAIEFIDQKNSELILTDEIADRLKSEIKSISTRR